MGDPTEQYCNVKVSAQMHRIYKLQLRCLQSEHIHLCKTFETQHNLRGNELSSIPPNPSKKRADTDQFDRIDKIIILLVILRTYC
jgi:hypothetical protein